MSSGSNSVLKANYVVTIITAAYLLAHVSRINESFFIVDKTTTMTIALHKKKSLRVSTASNSNDTTEKQFFYMLGRTTAP